MKKYTISIIALILGLVSLLLTYYLHSNKEKTAFVLLNDMYQKFELTKELEKKIEAIELQRKNILDSIKFNAMAAEKSNSKEFENLKQLYFYKEQEFEKSNEQVKQQFDEQIWKQINQYLSDYGKEYKYTYIHGANGNGSMMYVDEKKNITEQVLKYINNKYKGVK